MKTLTGKTIINLMRANKVTIRDLSVKTGITQQRIREVREGGLHDPYAAMDWVQAITGIAPDMGASAIQETWRVWSWVHRTAR